MEGASEMVGVFPSSKEKKKLFLRPAPQSTRDRFCLTLLCFNYGYDVKIEIRIKSKVSFFFSEFITNSITYLLRNQTLVIEENPNKILRLQLE